MFNALVQFQPQRSFELEELWKRAAVTSLVWRVVRRGDFILQNVLMLQPARFAAAAGALIWASTLLSQETKTHRRLPSGSYCADS